MTQKRSKYGNKKTAGFASKKEAKRAQELQLLEKAGKIFRLRFQVTYELLPKQKDANGKVVERAVKYIADADYFTQDGTHVVLDVKGYRTPLFILKRKLFLYRYGYPITEV